MRSLDFTHDSQKTSWVATANVETSDFPIQNLPLAVFRHQRAAAAIGVGIGDQIFDLSRALKLGLLESSWEPLVGGDSLRPLMGATVEQRVALRQLISRLLDRQTETDLAKLQTCLVAQSEAGLDLPCEIRDYTDFYASVFHATNVGMMLRPDNPLLPNYKHIPIGYHGRASSVVVSGTSIRRPWGQQAPAHEGESPTFGPCRLLDYELEVGCFIGQGNLLGDPIPIDQAESHLFGICLLNDWSARDVQKWEYQPLGPFLAKSFATSISPWVVTMEALAPFRCGEFQRPTSDPQPLEYLANEQNRQMGGIDLSLEVYLRSAKMIEQGLDPIRLSFAKFQGMYWTFAQMLAHHSSNGCNLQAGDLLGSGTVSGKTKDSRGSMLELTWDGSVEAPKPGTERTGLVLPTGEERKFLADGDEVTLAGFCENNDFRRIGLGRCVGTILSAHSV